MSDFYKSVYVVLHGSVDDVTGGRFTDDDLNAFCLIGACGEAFRGDFVNRFGNDFGGRKIVLKFRVIIQ